MMTRLVCLALTGILSALPAFSQSNALDPALALYAAAAYDDALNALDQLRTSARAQDTARIEYYRALCLLAIGRTTDAETAIEQAVSAEPFAQPSEADASPHVRAQFREVRRRVLPNVIERRFADEGGVRSKGSGGCGEIPGGRRPDRRAGYSGRCR